MSLASSEFAQLIAMLEANLAARKQLYVTNGIIEIGCYLASIVLILHNFPWVLTILILGMAGYLHFTNRKTFKKLMYDKNLIHSLRGRYGKEAGDSQDSI